MKKNSLLILSCIFCLGIISCASKKSDSQVAYDENYDYTLDESEIIHIAEPAANENFVADIDPVDLAPLFFLRKSGKTVKTREVKTVGFVPRTNALEFHLRDDVNEVAIILRKAERDKILKACKTFLEQYESRTLVHQKVNRKTAYFNSKCSVWFGLLSPVIGCERNDYYVNYEFIAKRPYLLICFVPSRTTSDGGKNFTPKVSLYMSPSQIRDFMEQISQEKLEEAIQDIKSKAYTY